MILRNIGLYNPEDHNVHSHCRVSLRSEARRDISQRSIQAYIIISVYVLVLLW
jgi:hypothetical protein